MKAQAKSKGGSPRNGRFTVEKKGNLLYINGNRILDPAGKPSVKSDRLRDAVQKVAARK